MKSNYLIILIIALFVFSCGNHSDKKLNQKSENTKKYIESLEGRLDSLSNQLNKATINSQTRDTIIADSNNVDNLDLTYYEMKGLLYKLDIKIKRTKSNIRSEEHKMKNLNKKLTSAQQKIDNIKREISKKKVETAKLFYDIANELLAEAKAKSSLFSPNKKKRLVFAAESLFNKAHKYGHKDAKSKISKLKKDYKSFYKGKSVIYIR